MRSNLSRCGLDAALDMIGGKWKTLILWELNTAPRRFGELRRAVEGISEKMLIQQLREMERDGIVHRHQHNEVPPRVEYSVTPFGASLNEALAPLCEWGERNMERIEQGLTAAAEGTEDSGVARESAPSEVSDQARGDLPDVANPQERGDAMRRVRQ